MEGRPSSEMRRPVAATLSLGALSLAAGALLAWSPVLAVGLCPLVFGVTDFTATHALGGVGPSVRVRIVARALASLTWGGAVSTIVASRGAELTSARLPLLAIALGVGTIIGVYGSAGARGTGEASPRPPLAEAPLIAMCDVATTGWVFVNALTAHGSDLRARVLVLLGIAVAVALRALLVARIAARDPESPALAAVGFVVWLGVASLACTLAATPMTWSGLGAALVLTLAAALAESRKRRALVVLLRGSLAFAFAAMLGIATFLAT